MQFDRLISDFEKDYLSQFPLLPEYSDERLVQFLAKSHVEFILIHPMRDGNGRLSRLLIDMMANKAGLGLLDYSLWDQNKEFYFRSIQAGMTGDYRHIARLISDTLSFGS